MLYTRKGDDGKTKLFSCDQRLSKSSAIAEALGTVDEINALLGVLKVKSGNVVAVSEKTFSEILSDVQQDLFIIQAQLAGAPKMIEEVSVKKIESWVDQIEKELPPIHSFFVSGGCELASLSGVARTVARRAERRVISALDEERVSGVQLPNEEFLLAYLNRLSSLLYAYARLANHRAGVSEEKPHY